MINPVGIGVTLNKITVSLSDPLAWLAGSFIGVATYLVEPGVAFGALWVVVACDLVSRIITESINHGGFWQALKGKHIRSDMAAQGTLIKMVAYFIMCIIATQGSRIIPYEVIGGLIANIIYSVLFFIELMSITENFLEAGVEEFSWLKRFSNKKLKEICDDGSEDFGNSENPI